MSASESVYTNMELVLDPALAGCAPGEATHSELDDIEMLDRTYRPRLLRFVAYSTGDRDLAETIAQDCLLKAYLHRDKFRGDCNVGTWLTRIAINMIRDQQRSRKIQFWRKAQKSAPDLSEITNVLPSRSSSPEVQLLAHERAKQVAVVLESLSDNQRTIFLMRFIEEMDLQEIVIATGMHMNTVKTHLHRAVKSVRIQLGGKS